MQMIGILAFTAASALAAQPDAALEAERQAFVEWLSTSAVSPYAAVYHGPLDDELVFGPGGDPALGQLPAARLEQSLFRLNLHVGDRRRTVPRNRPVSLGDWTLLVRGDRRRTWVTAFGTPEAVDPPGWYEYRPDLVIDGTLEPPEDGHDRRMLGLDGVEIEASLAGTFAGTIGDVPVRLTVYLMPQPGSEEADLSMFFRDDTNGNGTYPAGRFLALQPLGGNRYRADFNRARNPFCAYNTVFPCPLPWRESTVSRPIEAGERYKDPANGEGS